VALGAVCKRRPLAATAAAGGGASASSAPPAALRSRTEVVTQQRRCCSTASQGPKGKDALNPLPLEGGGEQHPAPKSRNKSLARKLLLKSPAWCGCLFRWRPHLVDPQPPAHQTDRSSSMRPGQRADLCSVTPSRAVPITQQNKTSLRFPQPP